MSPKEVSTMNGGEGDALVLGADASREEVASHARRALQGGPIRAPRVGYGWTVCRFVDGLEHGWPLRELSKPLPFVGPLGSSDQDPVALFTEKEAREIAASYEHHISFDAPVRLEAIRWRVRLYSHYDGSEVVYETGDYGEALLGFVAVKGAADRENTPRVAYLVPSLEGRVSREGLPLTAAMRAAALDEVDEVRSKALPPGPPGPPGHRGAES